MPITATVARVVQGSTARFRPPRSRFSTRPWTPRGLPSRTQPYDFLVQSTTWKLGAVSITILRRQFDKTYVAVAFENPGRYVTLNFIVVNGPDGWVISDVESPHNSLRMFLAQYRN